MNLLAFFPVPAVAEKYFWFQTGKDIQKQENGCGREQVPHRDEEHNHRGARAHLGQNG
jgi:hypothetical protein